MLELHARVDRQIGASAGALHECRQARDVVGLDVRLEHRGDRRADRGRGFEVGVHEVGVRIDDRELRMREAAEQVAGARALVVQERAQDHRRLLALVRPSTATGQPGASPLGKADVEPARGAPASAQQPHGVVGVHAVRPAAIRHDLHPAREVVHQAGKLVDRRRDGIGQVPRAILGSGPHVEKHHAALSEPRGQVIHAHALDLGAVTEIGVGQHLDAGHVLGRPRPRTAVHRSTTPSLAGR